MQPTIAAPLVFNDRILVIDDDADICEAYKAILAPQSSGEKSSTRQIKELLFSEKPATATPPSFTMRFALQGQEGFKLATDAIAAGEPFAVAFIDIRMPPGWDGMKTAARIRAIDPDIEIVIVTAYTDRSRDEIAEAVRPPHKLLYLRKPFDPDELKQIAYSLTEKWNISQAEAQQREELATLLNTTPAAIFTVDRELRVTTWNPAAEQITGYTAAEILGKPCPFQELADDFLCQDCRQKGLEFHCGNSMEISFRNKAGKVSTVEKNAFGLKDRSGKVIGLVESFWDITSRKEAEEALHESEERFRSLVETTSDWVWETDHQGRFTYCSPVCEAIYGYLPADLLGKSMIETLHSPESAPGFKQLLQECQNNLTGFQGVERLCRKKDGTTIFVETSATPVTSGRDRVIGFHGIDRDISERKRIAAEKDKLEEQYQQAQKLEALGTLAGGIAHDFNNALTPIIGYAQLGLLDLERNHLEKLQEGLGIILASANTAAELTKQILAYSRQQVLVTKLVSLNLAIEAIRKMLTRLIREDIQLQFDLGRDLWPVQADTGRLGQVLINLVVNAKDAISGGGSILIKTENQIVTEADNLFNNEKQPVVGQFVVLTVRDNGSGMDKATIERIFDPFFTTKPRGKGTGIGLSTVFGIIKQHGGHIVLHSTRDQGTTFRIFLPRAEQKLHPAEAPRNAARKIEGSETILIVEDSKEVLATISCGLKNFGYTVLEANGGEKAIELIHQFNKKIDMLVTDVVMPGISGKALAEVFRVKFNDLPILFISGHTTEIEPLDLQTIQRSFFLQKPFGPTQLATMVRSILDGDENPAVE